MDGEPDGDNPSGNSTHDPLAPSPVEPAVEQTEITKHTASQAKSEQNPATEVRSEMKALQILSLIFDAVLVIVGIGAVLVYRGQLNVMRGTLAEMQRSGQQSTDQVWQAIGNINWMAKSMDGSTKQSQQSMEASDKQSNRALNASVDASRNDQRAWLSVANLGMVNDPVAGQTFTVTYAVSNSGKTPAVKASTKTQLSFDRTEPAAPDWDKIIPSSQSVIFPNTTSLNIHVDAPAATMTKPLVDAYTTTRQTKIYFRVRLDYSDVYGRAHWSEVCNVHSSGDAADHWLSCAAGGNVDTEDHKAKRQ
jgi:hypothetical protein